ncbi:MAG: class I SAM-dependent methyltransferase [Nitrospirota bacterium]|nr:class I SAM-dependent methyltransferase [Nitrospirota bacterium]
MNKDKLSLSYDEVYSCDEKFNPVSIKKWPVNRNQALLFLANKRGKRLLEIGCGNGSTLAALGKQFDELHGIEFSGERVKTAARNLKDYNAEIIKASIEERVPYPDAYFDCIIWADVIEHIINLWSSMEEIVRILRPSGRLITVTPNIAKIKARIMLLLGRFPATSGTDEGFGIRPGEMFDGGHMHYFTYSMMRKLYSRYDLNVISEIGIGKYGRLHNFCRTILSSEVVTVGEKV